MIKKLLVLGVVLLLLGGSYGIWRSRHNEQAVRILETAEVKRGAVRQVLEQTGIIKPQVGAIVKIGTRATGVIERMLVKVGDRVSAGQLVAQIDSREIRSQLAEAKARYQARRAELARVEQVYPLRIREAEAQLALAETAAEYLASNYRRLAQLAEEGIISQDELDNVRQKSEVEQRLVAARRAVFERESREFIEERRKADLAMKQAKAQLNAVNIRLSYTQIVSPLDGTVSQVTAQEGETIVSGLQVANLITVLDTRRLEMWIYVDETDVGQVKIGQKLEFRVDAWPDRIFKGTVATVYPEPEVRENIVYYRALVAVSAEQAELLRPEMTTQVKIVVAEKADALRLPNAALKWVDGRQLVFVQRADGSVRQVVPELGLIGVTHSEVTGGLQAGEKVATQLILGQASAAAGSGSGAGGNNARGRKAGR
ncbi:efflux RND transporter periplasmic adaptor subunit [Syntrophotalea acetylenivorans]|uniref:efflux RND transporter periplasmic adaptor subunit n=1 Tax=Syntrophotalea acetylenivorans TaxID=1842532 RepID=UPI0009FB374E|nr:efflux RND transporter periplasmic adaptor subunit [Syntrophotalea acetylenivorans]